MRMNAIRTMMQEGLNITLATDDPLMFETDLTDCYQRYFDAASFEFGAVKRIALAGVDASWLDASRKAALRREFAHAIDALR